LAILGLIAAPLGSMAGATPSASSASHVMDMTGHNMTGHDMASHDMDMSSHTDMVAGMAMPCCPDEAPMPDCGKHCPMVACGASVASTLPTVCALSVSYVGAVQLVGAAGAAFDGIKPIPPPRPPKV
jgi:hypothetical protein